MKKLQILLVSAVMFLCTMLQANAQNLQVLYDSGRGCITSTVEMFRPDSFGSTYFFIDLDASPKMTGAYWEISRELNFWQDTELSWLSAHVEYNGGLNTAAGSSTTAGLADSHIRVILKISQRHGHFLHSIKPFQALSA